MSCLAGGVNWTEAESSSDESVAMIDRCYYISAHCCRPERSLLLSVVVAMTTGHQLQQPATTRLLEKREYSARSGPGPELGPGASDSARNLLDERRVHLRCFLDLVQRRFRV